jgi:kinesin family protein 5
MAEMMQDFDKLDESDSEKQLRETLSKLAYLDKSENPPTDKNDIEQQYRDLWDCKYQLQRSSELVHELVDQIKLGREESVSVSNKNDAVKIQLETVRTDYEKLLNGVIKAKQDAHDDLSSNEIEELTMQLESQYLERGERREDEASEVSNLRIALMKKDENILHLTEKMSDLASHNSELKNVKYAKTPEEIKKKEEEIEEMRVTMTTQLDDFASMKKKLMRDLQNRCEKVVELEITLDENKEVMKTALGSKSQQQKLLFLERNLEQLTGLQKQLVEQNSSLKKEFSVAERKVKMHL